MNESTFRRQVRQSFQRNGCFVMVTGGAFNAGHPDMLIMRDRQLWAVETKWYGREPKALPVKNLATGLQLKTLGDIREAGHVAGLLVGVGSGRAYWCDIAHIDDAIAPGGLCDLVQRVNGEWDLTAILASR